MSRWWANRPAVALAGALFLLLGQASPLAAADPSVPPGGEASPPAKVIVRFRSTPRPADAAAVRALGGAVRFTYRAIPAMAATIPETAITGLLRNPNVLEVERDHAIQAFDHAGNTGDLEYENQWGVEHIGAKPVHDAGFTGSGVRVAIIDTGIDYVHLDLGASPPIYNEFNNHLVGGRVPGWDFVNNDADPYDDNGHGTHVAGILAAEKNGYLISGVAPDVDLFSLKVLGASGEGDYSGLIAALDWSITNHMDVVNMSLGGREVSSALADIVAAADAAGIVMVAASGNVNPLVWQELFYGCAVAYPAAYPQVLATTFTNGSDGLTGYSCTGNEVDFASPGDQIVSTVPIGPVGSCMFCDPKGYSFQSGTSMASPHLAGAVALVLNHGIRDANGDGRLMPEIKAHLCANTVPGTSTSSRWTYAQMYGCGVINVRKALIDNPPPVDQPPPPLNQNPVAAADVATTDEDTPVTIAVLANDADPDGNPLSVTAAGPASHGAVVANANGTIGYTPAANWSGQDAFSYMIGDGNGGSASAQVTVTVGPVNDPPSAVADSAATAYQTSVGINVLANDSDIEGNPLTVVGVGAASHGTVSIGPGGTVTYAPAAGYTGQDSFTYTVSDGWANASAQVSVIVGAAPPAPVLHIADLDRSAVVVKKSWSATVRIRVVDQFGVAALGATVTGTWTAKGTATCVTDATGWCSLSQAYPASRATTTFTVTNISRSGATYNGAANADPDGDSTGTAIVINRP